MKRCTDIINHPLFREYINRNEELENTRIFCRHGMEHLLDTARIGYILALEGGLSADKEMIYAASLMHDIARCEETDEICHNEASARVAERILPECGFSADETAQIADAVRAHRQLPSDRSTLGGILYTADKLSRRCYMCAAHSECNWADEKKNDELII